MDLGIYKTYWKLSIAYRSEFMISLLVAPLRFFVLVMIWKAVYANSTTPSIGGYTLEGMVSYFFISSLIFTFLYDFVDQSLEEEVKSGNFITFMLKPLGFTKLAFMHKLANRFFAIIVEIIPIFVILFIFFKEYFILGNILLLIPSLCLSFVISYFIHLIVGTFAFWMTDIKSLRWLLGLGIQLSAGLYMPISLFPETIRDILAALPFQYILYVPIQIYLNAYQPLFSFFENGFYEALFLQLLWVFILAGIAFFVWKLAIRKFSGVGT